MKILEVHEVNYLTKPIYEFIEIPEELTIRGHEVTMVDYGEGTKKIFSLKTQTFRGNRVFPKSKVKIVRPGAIDLGELFGRFTGMISSWFVLKRLFKENKFDALLLYAVPTTGWVAMHHAKKNNVPVFFRTLDALSELRKYPFPLKYIIRALEKHIYKNADHIISLTPKMARYTGRKDCLPLYSAVNDQLFYPIKSDDPELVKLRKRWGLSEDDQIILYMGTLYDFGGLEIFINNIKDIRKNVKNAKFLLVGGGGAEKDLKELAEKEGVSEYVTFTGFVPYEDVTKYINISTLCVNPMRHCKVTRDILPIKILQYMACRKPTLSRDLKGTVELIPPKSGAIEYAKTDKEILTKAIGILKDHAKQQELSDKAYEFVIKNHAWPAFMDKLEMYLKKYANKNSNNTNKRKSKKKSSQTD